MSDLHADALFNDPRIAQARELVHAALADHQHQLTRPKPADAARRVAYDALVDQFGDRRGGALYYRYLGSGLGRGPLVELADGSVKYDMIGGIGVHGLGHSHPALVDAGFDAALRDTVMQGNLQQNAESAALVDALLRTANAGGAAMAHCFLTTSGAMANENALKLVFHRHQPADRLLAFERCFMGRSIAMAQVTDKAAYRQGLPTALAVDYVPFFDPASPEASKARAIDVLRAHLARYPGKHAAMCFEFVQGEGGYWPGNRDFFLALIDVLIEAGVAVMADEIQTFGRGTQPFAFQHFGLDEHVDVATVGKITQVCATLFRADYKPKAGLISQTFTGSTSSIFASLAVLKGMTDAGLYGPDGRNEQVRRRFVERFNAMADQCAGLITGPYGFGAMIAFTPLDGSAERAKRVAHALFGAGVIAFVAGGQPARVRMLPPVAVLRDEDIDAVCDIIEQVLTEVADSA